MPFSLLFLRGGSCFRFRGTVRLETSVFQEFLGGTWERVFRAKWRRKKQDSILVWIVLDGFKI